MWTDDLQTQQIQPGGFSMPFTERDAAEIVE